MSKELDLIYFSPTGSTQAIVGEITKGMGFTPSNIINITKKGTSYSVKGMVIIGSPVYGGRLPKVFIERVKQINMENTKCILVVVYGNRAFEDSLLELKDLIEEKGGNVIGAGAFIGEHSLSTERNPVAKDRPDRDDLDKAYDFGRKIKDRDGITLKEILVPGNTPSGETKPKPVVGIKTDEELCTRCNECIDVCPVDAIPTDNPLMTDGHKCLRCCACIKVCPVDARTLSDPLSLKLSRMVFAKCQERREPEIFL